MKPLEQVYGKLSALISAPPTKPNKALVLLHGVGSNERNLFEIAPHMTDNRMIVSLRAPLVFGPQAFAWFHVQFTDRGNIHNWPEAKASLTQIEEALRELSTKSEISLANISVFGFSQGAIMALGLALTSDLHLENYIAASGRTLSEFAKASQETPLEDYKLRKVYVTHGKQDSKLPVQLGRDTEKILSKTPLKLTYKEYNSDHTIAPEVIIDIRNWLTTP